METKRILAQWPLLLIFALTLVLSHVVTTPPQTLNDILERLGNPAAAALAVCLAIVAGLASFVNKELVWRRVYAVIAGISVAVLTASVASSALYRHI